ncbi:MAG: hypothetical protein AAF546_11215 [Verrucomicrobiota bacterium]
MKSQSRKTIRWGLICLISLAILIVGIVGIWVTTVQILAVDKFAMTQGDGSVTPQELASSIADKRTPQLYLLSSIAAFSGIAFLISTIGYFVSRKKHAEQEAVANP